MDFSLSPEIDALRKRIRNFVDEEIIPIEANKANFDAHENIREDILATLRDKVKSAGMWAPQVSQEFGGLGVNTVAMAACYEEMNRSIFGPACFNCAAPDEGNMFILNRVGTPKQKERWLRPIAEGRVRSAFAMTEPKGCGSDPSQTYTTATKDGDNWEIGRAHV